MMLVLLGSLGLGGCIGPNRPGWLSVNPNDWANRSATDDPILLDVAGPVEVRVTSFNGDVVIQGNPKLTQGQVTVMREAIHGYGRSGEAASSLEQIKYTARIVPGELGQALEVVTQTSCAEPHLQRAHVYIELPDIEGVTVHTTNGRVWVRNIRGKVDISTSEDDVRVLTNLAMNKPVTIVNRNGDIAYRVRGESEGKFDAQTVNGRATGFVHYGTLKVDSVCRRDAYFATLNNGANPITLRTVNGDIHIAVVSNPEHVGAMIVD